MVRKLDRAPMRNVSIFPFAKYSIEHSRGTEQANMSAMQWSERPASTVRLLGEQHSPGLAICCRIRQKILNFIPRYSCVREYDWSRKGDLTASCRFVGQDL